MEVDQNKVSMMPSEGYASMSGNPSILTRDSHNINSSYYTQ